MSKALTVMGIIGFLLGGFVWFWTLSTAFEIMTFVGIACLVAGALMPEKRKAFHPIGFYPPV